MGDFTLPGGAILALLIALLIGALIHGFFLMLAGKIVLKTEVTYGEGVKVAIALAVVNVLLGLLGGVLVSGMAMGGAGDGAAVFQTVFFLVISLITGPFIVGTLMKDNVYRPIGFARGFLVWILAAVLYGTVWCLCCGVPSMM